jgi:hypothetical protein
MRERFSVGSLRESVQDDSYPPLLVVLAHTQQDAKQGQRAIFGGDKECKGDGRVPRPCLKTFIFRGRGRGG